MQIVIDINDEIYKEILNGKDGWSNYVHGLIRIGIPLPKGHGRIADMDEAIKCIKDVNGEDAIWAISLIEWACSKRTIIEADKEDS